MHLFKLKIKYDRVSLGFHIIGVLLTVLLNPQHHLKTNLTETSSAFRMCQVFGWSEINYSPLFY